MCGIVGFITNESKKLEGDRSKFLKQSLIIDTLRGDDSTGVFSVGHEPLFDDGSAFWLKQVGTGHEFVDSEGYWQHFYDTEDYRAVVGHNRAATVGAVNTAGAHPFQVGPITLVHNGTLRSTHLLPEPMHGIFVSGGQDKEDVKVSVDSHAIAYNLAHHDAEDVIATLDGAFTLVWHDARDDSMNIIRNAERPLHMAISKQQDTLYFMSEAGMLHMLGDRLKLGLGPIYLPKEGQWLRWKSDTPLDAPEVKNCELYERPLYNRYGTGYDYDDDYDWPDGTSSRAMGGNNLGKVNPPSNNKVGVGGRQKEVPMPMQEIMMEYDLVTEDRLRFKPKSIDTSGVRSSVIGELDTGLKAILFNQSQATGMQMTRNWTVRPVGVSLTASSELLVIVKLVSTIYSPPQNATPRGTLMDTEIEKHDHVSTIQGVPYIKKAGTKIWVPIQGSAERDDEGRAMLGYERTLKGPVGGVTEEQYAALTIDGCALCHRMVGPEDAADITWTEDAAEFLCWDCELGDYYSSRIH